MADPSGLLQLLAETEAALTRESEAILAGQEPDAAWMPHKAELVRQLECQIPFAKSPAGTADSKQRGEWQAALRGLLQAAARNDAVLRGALRGGRILVRAVCDGPERYPGRPSSAPSAPASDDGIRHFDRRA